MLQIVLVFYNSPCALPKKMHMVHTTRGDGVQDISALPSSLDLGKTVFVLLLALYYLDTFIILNLFIKLDVSLNAT